MGPIVEFFTKGGPYMWGILGLAVLHIGLCVHQIRRRHALDLTPVLWAGLFALLLLCLLETVHGARLSLLSVGGSPCQRKLLAASGFSISLYTTQFALGLALPCAIMAGLASSMTPGASTRLKLPAMVAVLLLLGQAAAFSGLVNRLAHELFPGCEEPPDLTSEWAVHYYNYLGTDALFELEKPMHRPEYREAIVAICEELPPDVVESMVALIHSDVTRLPYLESGSVLEGTFEGGIQAGDAEGLVRAGTACMCLTVIDADDDGLDAIIDRAAAVPAEPEQPYVLLALREIGPLAVARVAQRLAAAESEEDRARLLELLESLAVEVSLREKGENGG